MYIKDKKVIISAAITGATHVPSLSAHLPKNPDEIIQSALEAHKAGAAVISSERTIRNVFWSPC